MPLLTCAACTTTREAPAALSGAARTPRGWKVLQERPYCPACKETAFSLRVLTLTVASPEDATWAELRTCLRELWADTTSCANWMVSQLYARDVRREPRSPRLPRMPYVYLYPEARVLYPRLSAQAVAALAQHVQRRYRSQRHDVLWTGKRTLTTYRYPVPCTVPAQAWSLHEERGRWSVSARLGDRRWTLRLRGGAHMRPQLERLRAIRDGEAERGALTIRETVAPGTTHHGTTRSYGTRLLLNVAAWLPKPATPTGSATLVVRTERDALLSSDGFRIDPSPLRGVLAADSRRRTALLTNLRLERRSGRGRREGLEAALRELSRRSRQRLQEACRGYAAHLAAHALARNARTVLYDDADRTGLPHFPWHDLRRRVSEKLAERNIEFVHVGKREDAA